MRASKIWSVLAVAAVTVVALAAIWKSNAQAGEAGSCPLCAACSVLAGGGAPMTTAAPEKLDFTLADQNDKQVHLADFADKLVVLEWINPDCPFVQRHYHAGTMAGLAEKYKDKGVVWLAINSTSSATNEANKEWVAKYKLAYPILDDHAGEVGRQYHAKTTPEMFIIKDHKIIYQGAIDNDPHGDLGAAAVNYVAKALDETLADKAVTTPQTKSYGCSVKYAK